VVLFKWYRPMRVCEMVRGFSIYGFCQQASKFNSN
jgi:hypothetical protein